MKEPFTITQTEVCCTWMNLAPALGSAGLGCLYCTLREELCRSNKTAGRSTGFCLHLTAHWTVDVLQTRNHDQDFLLNLDSPPLTPKERYIPQTYFVP